MPRRDELIQETTIDIQFRPVSGFASPHEKILELQLREFVESIILRTLNPRSLVQIVVQVLSIDTEAVNSVCPLCSLHGLHGVLRRRLIVDFCCFDEYFECDDVGLIGNAEYTFTNECECH